MSTYAENRLEKLASKIKNRTKRDGSPLPGYEQNVAAIRAEMEQLSIRHDLVSGEDDGSDT